MAKKFRIWIPITGIALLAAAILLLRPIWSEVDEVCLVTGHHRSTTSILGITTRQIETTPEFAQIADVQGSARRWYFCGELSYGRLSIGRRCGNGGKIELRMMLLVNDWDELMLGEQEPQLRARAFLSEVRQLSLGDRDELHTFLRQPLRNSEAGN